MKKKGRKGKWKDEEKEGERGLEEQSRKEKRRKDFWFLFVRSVTLAGW